MAKGQKKITVGIADDHSLLRSALAKLINSFEGYAIVFETDNGKDLCNKIVKQEIPDIVMLDINMPEMNGWECLKHLKSDASFKDIPVIIYTTSSAKSDVDIASSLGADRLVTKPDRFQDLLKILSGIIREIGGPNGSPA